MSNSSNLMFVSINIYMSLMILVSRLALLSSSFYRELLSLSWRKRSFTTLLEISQEASLSSCKLNGPFFYSSSFRASALCYMKAFYLIVIDLKSCKLLNVEINFDSYSSEIPQFCNLTLSTKLSKYYAAELRAWQWPELSE